MIPFCVTKNCILVDLCLEYVTQKMVPMPKSHPVKDRHGSKKICNEANKKNCGENYSSALSTSYATMIVPIKNITTRVLDWWMKAIWFTTNNGINCALTSVTFSGGKCCIHTWEEIVQNMKICWERKPSNLFVSLRLVLYTSI